jgi:hypothetical protein
VFNGINDRIRINDPGSNSVLDVDQITMSMRVNARSFRGSWQGLLVKQSIGVYEAWLYSDDVQFGAKINGSIRRETYPADLATDT